MKKYVAAVLAIGLLFSIAGCGETTEKVEDIVADVVRVKEPKAVDPKEVEVAEELLKTYWDLTTKGDYDLAYDLVSDVAKETVSEKMFRLHHKWTETLMPSVKYVITKYPKEEYYSFGDVEFEKLFEFVVTKYVGESLVPTVSGSDGIFPKDEDGNYYIDECHYMVIQENGEYRLYTNEIIARCKASEDYVVDLILQNRLMETALETSSGAEVRIDYLPLSIDEFVGKMQESENYELILETVNDVGNGETYTKYSCMNEYGGANIGIVHDDLGRMISVSVYAVIISNAAGDFSRTPYLLAIMDTAKILDPNFNTSLLIDKYGVTSPRKERYRSMEGNLIIITTAVDEKYLVDFLPIYE